MRVGGARPPSFQPVTYHVQKLQCTLLLRGQIHFLYVISTLYVLCGLTREIFFILNVTNILTNIFLRKKSLNVSWKQKAAEEADLVLSDDADSDVDQVSIVPHSLILHVLEPVLRIRDVYPGS